MALNEARERAIAAKRKRDAAAAPVVELPKRQEQPTLEIGAIVKSGGRIWRVGLVNGSRARLDPITGLAVVANPVSGRTFQTYGDSINISPQAVVEEIDLDTLDDDALARLARLQTTATKESKRSRVIPPDDEGEDDMAETQTAVPAKVRPAIRPVAAAPKAQTAAVPGGKTAPVSKAAKNDARVAKAVTAAKQPREPKPKGEAAKVNDCVCGCGGKTAKYFVPGHDARFKGWLLKMEKGEESGMPKEVAARFTWKKKGEGRIPTKLWNGNAHSGFIAD